MRYHEHLSNISKKAQIGRNCTLHAGIHIHDKVAIGDNCKIQALVFMPNGVTIENNVFIGPCVCFTNDPTLGDDFEPVPTIVMEGAKIGANSTIIAGIVIGKNAIIGCGSVVLTDIPDNQVWAGNPARFIRKL